ncbi:MAG TPA: 30S ribosomal protein S20 [Bryobacteraceae bacterium]|nr:30S ribosomal protein S20 [Bryobacteraceae bacterium]
MANHFSALKRVRQTEHKTAVNRLAKTRLRHQIRTMRRGLAAKEQPDLKALMQQTFSVVDKAAQKGYIKRGTAARYKKRLHARIKIALGEARPEKAQA